MEEAMGYKLTAVWYNCKNQKLGFDKSSVCDWEKKSSRNIDRIDVIKWVAETQEEIPNKVQQKIYFPEKKKKKFFLS